MSRRRYCYQCEQYKAELKWRRKAMKGSKAEKAHYARMDAEREALWGSVVEMIKQNKKLTRLQKVTALANDIRGNEHERVVAAQKAADMRRNMQRV